MTPASLLILGGSGFVGPAVVQAALAAGWAVTTFHRGPAPPTCGASVRVLHGDRHRPADLAPLAGVDWDLVLDTWSGAPRAVRESCAVLRDRAARYVYISSCSVYRPPPPMGLTEATPVLDASPDADTTDYAADKRGGELAVAEAFGDRALLLRPGLILGPGENVGRLPWWLARMARGGDVLCPGPQSLALQYIDARDLAAFALDAASAGASGPVNTVSPRGHATMGELLAACRDAAAPPGTRLRWVAPEPLLAAGVQPWTELPVWIPPGHEFEALHGADVTRALALGLRCRPVTDTVRDTWAWAARFGPAGPPHRSDLPAVGLDPAREQSLLAAAG